MIIISAEFARSQPRGLLGIVVDSSSNKPLVSAHIILAPIDVVDFPHYTTTNEKGTFELRGIQPGRYTLEITYLGYQKYIDTIQIRWGRTNLDTIRLSQSFVTLKEVTVQEKIVPVEQVGDTLQFNAAAFKVAPNATLEELVLKFPGVEKEDNVIKVQGEEVKKVLVDGRRFFTEDPNVALRTLPAEIVEKVQLFDKKSEEAELTGFEDDQTVKAFNVLTRVDKRQGNFGRAGAGYGTNTRYVSGLSYNQFSASQRLSILGMSNNINESSFTLQDITESNAFEPGRGRGRQGFRSGGGNQNQSPLNLNINLGDGNNKLYAGGLNYSYRIINKADLNGSYIFSQIKNFSDSRIKREYISELSGLSNYSENNFSNRINSNHVINFAVDYFLDSSNIIRIKPNLEFNINSSYANSTSENFLVDNSLLNSNKYLRNNELNAYSISNQIIYSYRFPLKGRTLTFVLNTDASKSKNEYDINSEYFTFDANQELLIDTTIQTSNYRNNSLGVSTTITYTEPLSERGLIRLRITPSFSKETRDRENVINDAINQNLMIYDTLNSNSFENQNSNYRSSISYQYNGDNYRLEADLMFQYHMRLSKQKFPIENSFRNNFLVILPSFEFSYRITDVKHLRIEYNTRPNIPSISQLQNTIDFSNPLFLRTGNPNLNKAINNNFRIRYFISNPEKGTFTALHVNSSYIIDNIRTNTLILQRDTIIQSNLIKRGTQLSYPVNVGNSFSSSINLTYSFKVALLKSNISFNSIVGYVSNPGLINGRKNITNQLNIAPTLGLSSYQPELDYRFSYSPNFTYTMNTLNKNETQVLTHRLNFITRIIFLERWFLGTNLTYFYNPQVAEETNKKNVLMNLSVGIRILPQSRGEIKLEIYDLFNQKNRIRRIVLEDYIEDRNVLTLQRFFLLSFTYNFRKFY